MFIPTMDGENTDRIVNNNDGQVTGRNQQNNRQFTRPRSVSGYYNREEQRNYQRNSTTNLSSFRFRSTGAARNQDDSEGEIPEEIEAHRPRRGDNLSNRNQRTSTEPAGVTVTIVYDRQHSQNANIRESIQLNVPQDFVKNLKITLRRDRACQTDDSPSTNTAPSRQSEQTDWSNNEISASTYLETEEEIPGRFDHTIENVEAGDRSETNVIVIPKEADSKFQAFSDVEEQGIDSSSNNRTSLAGISKSPLNRKNTNQTTDTERVDQIHGFVTYRQSIVLGRREEKVHPRVEVLDYEEQERSISSITTGSQQQKERPNCHDLVLFETFYVLSQDSSIIKKSRRDNSTTGQRRLDGAGQMCRIRGETLIAVVQTTVGIICLQTDDYLSVLYKIDTSRQYLSICHLSTFQLKNTPRPSEKHSFAVTCTERREDSWNLDELIFRLKPNSSPSPPFYEESALKLRTPSLSGICSILFVNETHLVVSCRIDHIHCIALMLYSNLSILWVCNLKQSATDIAFWDPIVLVCVPDECEVKAINLENGKIVNKNLLARTDDQGWKPHRISVCGDQCLVKLYSRDQRQVKIVEYTMDEDQTEMIRRERCFYR